jgi:hypothetical protein
MKPRLQLLLALAATGALVAGTEAAAAPAPAPAKQQAATGQGAQVTAAKKRRRRPGCNRFCRQAGGFGSGPEGEIPVVVSRRTVRVGSDGIVGVHARCTLAKTCDGAILLNGHVAYGRANLHIPAHATRVVYVAVPRAGRRYLSRHRRDRSAFATVALKSDDPVSTSHTFTLLPHR